MKPDTRNTLTSLKFLALMILVIMISCRGEKKPQVETTTIHPYKSVDKVSDTIFFTLIGKMSGVNEITMLDVNEKRLIVCDKNASWNDLYVLNDSEVIIYELNTMAFHFFRINPLSHQ